MKIALTLLTVLLAANSCLGQLILKVDELTETTLTFSISGTMQGPVPDDFPYVIDINAPVDWIIQDNGGATNFGTLSDSPLNDYTLQYAATIEDSLGSYLFMQFTDDLTTATTGTGMTVIYTITPGAFFDPNAVTELTLSWGYNFGSTQVPVGTVQSTAPIPEPATGALLALGLAGLALRRRR